MGVAMTTEKLDDIIDRHANGDAVVIPVYRQIEYTLAQLKEALEAHEVKAAEYNDHNDEVSRTSSSQFPRHMAGYKEISHEELELAAAVALAIDILEGRGSEVVP